MVRHFTVSAIFALLAVVCTLSGCASGDSAAPPNVVIITMDTVRADHTGCYGYPVNTTPVLDALAGAATRYTRFIASSSWTVPTHASFFTGKFAFEHGAHGFKVDTAVNNVNPLPAGQLTLAEIFWNERYTTGGFVANDAFLGRRWKLNQGFEMYHVERTRCTELNKKVFAWLETASKKPFFLFVNYMDAHRPYDARTVPGLLPRPVVNDRGKLLDSLYEIVMPGTNPAPADLKQKVVDQYDTALRHLDTGIGELIEKLKSLGVYENTVFVVTSDHGEFFGEHYLVEHSKDIYEEVLSVPLIVKYPGQTKGVVENTVASATDLPHLILSAFSGKNWEAHLRNFPDAPGNHEIVSEIYYTRTKDLFHPVWGHRFDRIRTAIYDWPFKYIDSTDGENELYNLEVDLVEAVNLISSDEATAKRMAGRLQDFFESRARSLERIDQKPLTEEERRRLKSLGYIGE